MNLILPMHLCDSWPFRPEEAVGRLLATRPQGSPFASANPQTGSPKGRPPLEGKAPRSGHRRCHPARGLQSRVRLPRKGFQRTPGGQPKRGIGGESPPTNQFTKNNKFNQKITKSIETNKKKDEGC